MNENPRGDYAEVNDLRMYYQVHGDGDPLVLLHGAYMTADDMGALLPGLAENRRVIVPEMQGHGRTADVADRPITYEGMADDTAALLRHLGIERADVFGYSMGAGVTLQLAIRHPSASRRLVLASVSYTSEGMQPELHEMAPTKTPEMFAGSPFEAAHIRRSRRTPRTSRRWSRSSSCSTRRSSTGAPRTSAASSRRP